MERRPVVVGVDGSAPSALALDWALREAAARHAPVRVISAWTWDTSTTACCRASAAREAQEQLEGMVALAFSRLATSAASELRHAGVTTELVQGDPATQLIERSSDADLLVLASHGEHLVHDTLLGSVAEVCMRHAACPVVVVPAYRQPVLTSREPVIGTA